MEDFYNEGDESYMAFAQAIPDDRSARSRNWVFTWNNFSPANIDELKGFPHATWLIIAQEVAPSTGTRHLQGAFVCKNAITWASLHRKFDGCWFSPMRGTVQQNIAYCSKEDIFMHEQGERPQPKGKAGGVGNKRKWDEAKAKAIAGDVDSIEADIFIPYYRSLTAIAASHQRKPANLDTPNAYWFYGLTGTGKSHAAREENPDHYLKGANKWFCGYKNEECVIIEDLDNSHAWMGHVLKIWGDKYPFNAEVKGASMCIRPNKIVVTSNYHPSEIWSDRQILDPILRRFKIVHFRGLEVHGEVRAGEEVRAAYVPGFVPPPALPIIPVLQPEDIQVDYSNNILDIRNDDVLDLSFLNDVDYNNNNSLFM